MLESVKLLHTMGYTLYGSSGTADFYNEHGIAVRGAVQLCATRYYIEYNIEYKC